MRCQAYWTNPLISGPLWAKTAISSMAADTKTKDDWPLSLPPPPKFNVPPPPIPAFVEACLHQQEQDSTVRQNGGTYNFYFKIFKICNIFSLFCWNYTTFNCTILILKGGLISESFLLWIKSQKIVTKSVTWALSTLIDVLESDLASIFGDLSQREKLSSDICLKTKEMITESSCF